MHLAKEELTPDRSTITVIVIFSTVNDNKKTKVEGIFPPTFLTDLALAEQIKHQRATFLWEFLCPQEENT